MGMSHERMMFDKGFPDGQLIRLIHGQVLDDEVGSGGMLSDGVGKKMVSAKKGTLSVPFFLHESALIEPFFTVPA